MRSVAQRAFTLARLAAAISSRVRVELARDVRDVPEQVAQLFGHALLEEPVRFAVAQMLLVFAQELAGFASETEHGDDKGKDIIRALARRDTIGAQGLLLVAVEIHHRLLRRFIQRRPWPRRLRKRRVGAGAYLLVQLPFGRIEELDRSQESVRTSA